MSYTDAEQKWSRENTSMLIHLLRRHECLWNNKSPDYKNRQMRHLALEEIKNALEKSSTNDITKKIHTIRTQFRRELKELITSRKSGAEDIYVPKLWCFEDLRFLQDDNVPLPRSCICNLEEIEVSKNTHSVKAELPVKSALCSKSTCSINVDIFM